MSLSYRRALSLTAAALAVPLVLGTLPGASADPGDRPGRPDHAGQGKPDCTPPKSCQAAPDPTDPVDPADPEPTAPDARVVVAAVDSGVNPYHEFFHRSPSSVTPEVLAELGIGPDQVITLTRTGDFAADFAADKERVWDRMERETPYWFAGTNLIGASFTSSGTPILPDTSGDSHGTGVAASVLNANPEAIVVMAEGTASAAAETFAFTHPAVDVVTTSYGIPGSPPVPFHLTDSFTGVVELGKLHYGASDNSPALSPPDGTSGPWWTIAVAGFHENGSDEDADGSGGREALSGNVIDVVSDFTQTLPYCHDCQTGTRSVSGTSFATPRSAGTASKVLLEARRAAGHVGGITSDGAMVDGPGLTLTNWQLRRAFEEAAHYPGLADFSPVLDTHLPVLDAAPYLQTGWGVFSPDEAYGVVDEALAQLGVAGEARAPKGGEACAFNTLQFELRKAYWDNVAIGSESFLTAEDPYLRC